MRKLMMILSSTVLLNACGTTGTITPAQMQRPIAKDEARITVTRDTSLLYLAAAAKINANGQTIADLGRGGSVVHDVKAGTNFLQVSTPTALGQFVVRFDAKPQEIYNFRVLPNSGALLTGSAWGMLGDAVNAHISDKSGYFELELQP